MITLVEPEKVATKRTRFRGPKVTVKEKAEPCSCCRRMIRRGTYSPTLKFWCCDNAEACVKRMVANAKRKKA